MELRHLTNTLAVHLVLLLGASASFADPAPGDWPFYAHDASATRFSPLDQITAGNVALLERAWTFQTGDFAPFNAHYAECTPLMVNGVLYVITSLLRLAAIDAVSGKELWRFCPEPPFVMENPDGIPMASRGVAWWQSGEMERVFLPVRDGRLYSIDPVTHLPDPAFGDLGHIDLRAGLPEDGWYLFLSSPPALCQDVLLQPFGMRDISERRGAYVPLRAFDVRTGKLLWVFDTVPQPGQFGHDTWGGDSWKDRAGCNPWAPISVDQERGIFYVSIGAPNLDKWGGDRPGDNLFGNSIVALNARTGERLWHFQTVHHDLWDYDLPAQPNLFEWQPDGQRVPAVSVVGKTGFVYEFNRLTGEPLFPVEERPVPASDFPGEQASPTQPFPTRPPAFARQSLTSRDLPDMPDHLRAKTEQYLDGLRSEGLFTPPSERGTLVVPGQIGGGNWSGAAVSPEGMMFVTANECPFISTIKRSDGPFGVTPVAVRFRHRRSPPMIAPPWGTISKIDLNLGELLWQRPLGEYEFYSSSGAPPPGRMNLGGATITAGGLVFAAGTMDAKFRAFSADTGDILFQTQLEVAGYSAPITYLGGDGRQYVVVFAGGGSMPRTTPGDYVAAYCLK